LIQAVQRIIGVASLDFYGDSRGNVRKTGRFAAAHAPGRPPPGSGCRFAGPWNLAAAPGLRRHDKQALGDTQQALTQVGQAYRAFVAMEQQHPEAFLKLSDLIGDGRLA
jgi:hypothetical protein